MNKILNLSILLTALALSACGGSDNCDATIAGGCIGAGGTLPQGDPGQLPAGSISFITFGELIIDSDVSRQDVVQVGAIVSDSSGGLLSGVRVDFASSNNGSVNVTQPITDSDGVALAEVNNGTDLSNRNLIVTATVFGTAISASSPTIAVAGTTLDLSPANALIAMGESQDFIASLKDSKGAGIQNVLVTASSANTTVVSGSGFTGTDGEVSVTLTGTVAGPDTLSVDALGETDAASITISNDRFEFTSPVANAEIPIGTNQVVELVWEQTIPVVGSQVNFACFRCQIAGGDIDSDSDNTDGTGTATVTISAITNGTDTIVATDPVSGTSNTLNVEFVAVTPAALSLQASPTRVDVGEQSEITANVKDANSNNVKNALVRFELTDSTGGFLQTLSSSTDSDGDARTIYTGGDTPSATDGVSIRAYVDSNPAIENTVALTVAGVARDVTIGTGRTVFELGTAVYGKEWVVFVKDGVGNPISGAQVEVSLLPTAYRKGWLRLPDPLDPLEALFDGWLQVISTAQAGDATDEYQCDNEDTNYDGIWTAAKDYNGNGILDPGNDAVVAAVDPAASSAQPCTLEGFNAGSSSSAADVITNANGIARVCVYWPENYAWWLEVAIEARTQVSGTEFGATDTHWLPMLAAHQIDESVTPANHTSPYGTGAACVDPN